MKTILIVIASLMPLIAGADERLPRLPNVVERPTETQLPEVTPGAPTPLIQGPNWHLIRSVAGPTIPGGWQIVGVEGVLQDGNSMSAWQVYLYKPTTRQTAGWLIGIP
jgi:hypothetical protein